MGTISEIGGTKAHSPKCVLVLNGSSLKELSNDMQTLGFERCRAKLQVQMVGT
jgi:hypothetical protein